MAENKSKAQIIDEVKANLPLPEQPPVPSDWNSADARTVNLGAGNIKSSVSGTSKDTTGTGNVESSISGTRKDTADTSSADTSSTAIMTENKSKAQIIDEVKANLPLPEQPPVPSDWNSADARTVNLGAGNIKSSVSGTSKDAAGTGNIESSVSETRKDDAGTTSTAITTENKSKAQIIDEVKANLPLPEQPPNPSDWNSADARTVNL